MLAPGASVWELVGTARAEEQLTGVLMKKYFIVGLTAGVILGVMLIVVATYVYFAGGFAPVATSAAPMPFERKLAHLALHARIGRELPKTVPIEAAESNLMAGAAIYQEHCAVCHGWPGATETAIAKGMFPHPPQLFKGKGVTDDPPGETYWKAANGIRLTGMPGFNKTLKEKQLWQVSLVLAHADTLPTSVKDALRPKDLK
jgi:thiosulfate dehydrogenase